MVVVGAEGQDTQQFKARITRRQLDRCPTMNDAAALSPSPESNRTRSPADERAWPSVAPGRARPAYLAALTWAFTLFNSVRTLAYLPTMWAIWASGDSSQHSLWTWCTWLGANATMAAWLYEHNGQRVNRAVIVNIGNATMCAATVVLIAAHRGWPW